MINVVNLLKPAPHIPELTDPGVVNKVYKYWRVRIFYSMYIGYLFYYLTRKSFTFVTPFLSSDLGLTKGEIGWLASVLSITYGISKFASGVLCDRSNPRYFMALGLIFTGICNIFFGLFTSVFMFTIFWGLNGFFQGWGWPSCTKQLTHWFSRSERGAWWSICSTSHTAGGILVAVAVPCFAKWYGWQFGMYIPGVLCIAVGCWLLNRLRDVPQSLGLPPVEKFKKEIILDQIEDEEDKELLPVKQILFKHVLNNKYVWVLAASYFFVYVIRTAINDWSVLYLGELKGYTPLAASVFITCFEIGGGLGILAAGWGSDFWFEGKRVPLIVLSSFGMIFAMIGYWYLEPQNLIITALLFAAIGFLVFGPQMLVGLAAAEFVSKKAASTANGFVGCFAYLGAAAAGYPLGNIIAIWGWYAFVIVLMVCAAICTAVSLPIWSVKAGKVIDKEEEANLMPKVATR